MAERHALGFSLKTDEGCIRRFLQDFAEPDDGEISFTKEYVARSGVKVSIHAHHGLHSLRATVATKLLSADVSPDIIFSFLGHSDRESLGHYIRLDIENLRECALSFEDGDLL